jgi:hypothetical protein
LRRAPQTDSTRSRRRHGCVGTYNNVLLYLLPMHGPYIGVLWYVLPYVEYWHTVPATTLCTNGHRASHRLLTFRNSALRKKGRIVPPSLPYISLIVTSPKMSSSSPSKPVVFATSGLGGMLGWVVVHPANTCAGAYVDSTAFSRSHQFRKLTVSYLFL